MIRKFEDLLTSSREIRARQQIAYFGGYPPHFLMYQQPEAIFRRQQRLLTAETVDLGGQYFIAWEFDEVDGYILCRKRTRTMIEVVLNDRLGKKVRVKCNEDDTIGDLKKLAAAQLGTRPEKLKIQKWYVKGSARSVQECVHTFLISKSRNSLWNELFMVT